MDELIQLIANAPNAKTQWMSRDNQVSIGLVEIGGRTIRVALDDLGPIPPAPGSEIAV